MSIHNAFTAATANAATAGAATAAGGAAVAASGSDWTTMTVAVVTAAAGAATAVGFPQYKSLEMKGKLFAIGVGMAFSIIMAPIFAPGILKFLSLGVDLSYIEGRAIVFYVLGLIGYTMPPILMKKVAEQVESRLNGTVKQEVVDKAIEKALNKRRDASDDNGQENQA